MKKHLLLLLVLFCIVAPRTSSADYNDSVRAYARKYGISMKEARKRLDKEINDALKTYATETKKERTAIKGPNPSVYVPYDIITKMKIIKKYMYLAMLMYFIKIWGKNYLEFHFRKLVE